MLKKFLLFLALVGRFITCYAGNNEQLVQSVHGHVIDIESGRGIPGVIVFLKANNQRNAMTDSTGYFLITGIPLGRQSFQFSMTGYETRIIEEVAVTSGRQLELSVGLKESIRELKEFHVKGIRNMARAQNEFASVSSRSFDMEETRRYAASISDPARMASNFSGVSGSSEMSNGIVVRGNSPAGVLWRLEGIEIPNPNHFSMPGGSAGAISMLNANSLGTSDFYTAAFPAEIGNATSGVFDLQLRDGNSNKPEHSVQLGTSKIEVSTEGAFRMGSKASYLVNYRYSNPVLIKRFLPLKGVVPTYQDLSFKLHFPTTHAGTFNMFGVAGLNAANKNPGNDSTKWTDDNPNFFLKNKGLTGIVGASHQYYFNELTYIKTVVSGSLEKSSQTLDTLNPGEDYRKVPVKRTDCTDASLKLSVMLNAKMDPHNTFRTGISLEQLNFKMAEDGLDEPGREWLTLLSDKGNTQYLQGFAQWKKRVNDRLTVISGVHLSWFALNHKYSIEPRVSATYQLGRHTLSLASGLHTKPEHISTYLLKKENRPEGMYYPNKDLELVKAFHNVAGYEVLLPYKVRLKAEVYYQKLFDVAVEQDPQSGFSILNSESMMNVAECRKLVSEGTGENYGLDLSLEKPFSNNWYFLFTGSLFRSTYTNYAGRRFNTRYDRRFNLNLVAGKEFHLDNEHHVAGVNLKLVVSGGQKESPIDLERSVLTQKTEYITGQYYTHSGPAYFRTDASVYFKINNKNATHSIQFDVQNLTDHSNYYYSYFDKGSASIRQVSQLGILPSLSYRIEF